LTPNRRIGNSLTLPLESNDVSKYDFSSIDLESKLDLTSVNKGKRNDESIDGLVAKDSDSKTLKKFKLSMIESSTKPMTRK